MLINGEAQSEEVTLSERYYESYPSTPTIQVSVLGTATGYTFSTSVWQDRSYEKKFDVIKLARKLKDQMELDYFDVNIRNEDDRQSYSKVVEIATDSETELSVSGTARLPELKIETSTETEQWFLVFPEEELLDDVSVDENGDLRQESFIEDGVVHKAFLRTDKHADRITRSIKAYAVEALCTAEGCELTSPDDQ